MPDDLPTRSVDDDIKGPIDADGLADATAKAGIAALEGLPGPMRESLVYGAAIYLQHLGILEIRPLLQKKSEKYWIAEKRVGALNSQVVKFSAGHHYAVTHFFSSLSHR